jgi:hypothetical protein
MLAQKIKLLAHDNKPRAACLLNLPAAFQPAGFWLVQIVLHIFSGSELASGGGA